VARAASPPVPQLSECVAGAATGIARAVSQRLLISETLPVHLAGPGQAGRRRSYWDRGGLAGGDIGLAVLAAALEECHPGEGWGEAGISCLQKAVASATSRDASLYSGLAGLAYAGHLLDRSDGFGLRVSEKVEPVLLRRTAQQVEAVRAITRRDSTSVFDLISGLTGQCVYLLSAASGAAQAAGQEAISALVWLLRPGGDEGLHWACAPPGRRAGRASAVSLNLGLAHGMPGVLALLSIAELSGRSAPGALEAVEWNAGWLLRNITDDSYGPNWPAMRDLEPQPTRPYPRAAWCYGAAGLGRALMLAADALGDRPLKATGASLLVTSYRRLAHSLVQAGAGFCHGLSGVLYLLAQAAADYPSAALERARSALLGHLISMYDDDLKFGFSFPAVDNPARDSQHPGLLTGAAGVALALMKAATGRPLGSDRVFLAA
jgi:lantibiotic biosynthesis protein